MEPRKKSERRPQSLFLSCLAFALCVRLRTVSAGECPADGRTWVPFGDRCYHFVHGEEDQIKSYTFEAARSHCTGFGLLTIHSAEENDFVMSYSPEVWKGGSVNIWLGMKYDTDDDTMKWSNNRSVTFTNWEYSPFSPDIPQGDICVALHSVSGRWENVSCQDDVENGVVCETPQKAEKPRPKPSATVSALVILSVVAIVGVSAVIWFLYQKHSFGSTMITAFEYHPPFRVLDSDQSCLVEAEETDTVP
ncbi:PREDICTED: CD302 antigen [Poecilia mexicana]|uniref:C-type lectin domain-containing protein n=1 Tax=Poecilia mexicana TaxID=48701 RepID=A0A3B3XEU8_9TELE|nr:PREDICTED: CD302 antigen [Poecilia mexicana]